MVFGRGNWCIVVVSGIVVGSDVSSLHGGHVRTNAPGLGSNGSCKRQSGAFLTSRRTWGRRHVPSGEFFRRNRCCEGGGEAGTKANMPQQVCGKGETRTGLDMSVMLPERNPTADREAKSSAGVAYERVLEALDVLYPPQDLERRNAISRTDGYWAYVSQDKEPPQHLTYGEYDLHFFAQLLDRAVQHFRGDGAALKDWSGKVFADIGSGTGRLVLGAAALHPNFQRCRGIELLQGIHNVAVENLEKCRQIETDNHSHSLPHPQEVLRMAPVEFACGSFNDPHQFMADIDVAFVFSSSMSGETLSSLAGAIGRQLKPGAIIITTDYNLAPLQGTTIPDPDDPSVPYGPYEIEIVENVDGWCWLTGGDSTAIIHRVVQSQWSPEAAQGPRQRPQLSVEEQAYRVVKAMEDGTLTDTDAFLRNVRNNMIFAGLPPEWLPDTEKNST